MKHIFYKIKNNLDLKVIGCYPQVDCLTIIQCNILSVWKTYKVKPHLKFKMKNKAKLTDVLTTTCGPINDYLISPRMKDLLMKYNLMGHQIWDVDLYQNNKILTYYWIHLSQPDWLII